MKKYVFLIISLLCFVTVPAICEPAYTEVSPGIFKWVYTGLVEYDSNGNIIHLKYPSYATSINEHWYEYNTKGNMIRSKTISFNAYEFWYEYDAKGNMIHSKHSNGSEEWYEYDAKGNIAHKKESNDDELWELWNKYTYYSNRAIKTKTVYANELDYIEKDYYEHMNLIDKL